MKTKECPTCHEVKPLDQFHKNKQKKDGHRYNCAACHIAYMVLWQRKHKEKIYERRKKWMQLVVNGETNQQRLQRERREKAARGELRRYRYPAKTLLYAKARRLRRFGITQEQYDVLVEFQFNRCALCNCKQPDNRDWNIDHCHNSKQVRGLLCSPCNFALHKLEADLEWGIKAIAYLQSPPALIYQKSQRQSAL